MLYELCICCLLISIQIITPIINKTGKTVAAIIPILRLSLNRLETDPTTVGPIEHPTSPASAKKANIAVPPLLILADDMLNVPGQRIPTAKPHMPHPIRLNIGNGESEIIR